MKTILLLTLFSFPVFADPPADAPLVGEDGVAIGTAVEHYTLSVPVEPGSRVLFRGQCIEEAEFVRREKINVRNAFIASEAQEKFLISTPVLIAIVAGVVAATAGITIGVSVAVLKK